jgi:formylmethanofuran:tetrahydromethanopterin formyltransferase
MEVPMDMVSKVAIELGKLLTADKHPTLDALARAAIAAMNDVEPIVRASDGGIVHELRGAPRDLWLVLMAAALTSREKP